MASSIELTDDVRRQVAMGVLRLARHLPDPTECVPAWSNANVKMAETFAVYRFDGRVGTLDDFTRNVAPVGMFHHQVFVGDRPAGIALSLSSGSHDVTSYNPTPLAVAFDRATSMLDERQVAGEIRVLLFSAYKVTVLWVVNDDHSLICPVAEPLPPAGEFPLVPLADFLATMRELWLPVMPPDEDGDLSEDAANR